MYNSNNKQFLFKQTSGKVWSFYRDERAGLCYSTLSKRNNWSEPVPIQKNFHQAFHIDMDYEDRFHIIFQDKQGNIFYTLIDSSNINTTPVLNSKSPSSYDKHLYLIPNKKDVHIFFVIDHNNSAILSHQILAAGTVNAPKVIDYVIKNGYPYSVLHDKSGNIYVFYQVSDGKYNQLGFKKYLISQRTWGEFTPITRYNGDCEFPKTIIDSKDIIHICYQRHNDKQFELVYEQKMPDRNLWTGETVIHSSLYPFSEASLVIVNNNTIVFWVRDDVIYYSASEDNAITWSKPSRYNFYTGRQLLNMVYKSNEPIEYEKIAAKDIPGSFINGYKLAFCQDSSNINNISPDELRNLLLDGFKTLRGSVEELQDSNIAIKENILNLDSAQNNLNRELVKYSVKLSLLENELTQLKVIKSRFESLKNTIDALEPTIKSIMSKLDTAGGGLQSSTSNSGLSEINGNEYATPEKDE